MRYDDLLSVAQTGDLIFATGTSFFTKVICEATGVNWSHAACFVWGQDVGWEDGPYVWEADGDGVGEVPFDEHYNTEADFATRLSIPYAGKVGWRQLIGKRTIGMFRALRDHCDLYRGVPYETSKLEMLKATLVGGIPGLANDTEALRSQFCCHPSVQITMGDGTTKEIANVHPGDTVINHTGCQCRVSRVFVRDVSEPVISIRSSNCFGALLLTKGHPVYSIESSKKWRMEGYRRAKSRELHHGDFAWTPAGSLAVGDLLFTPQISAIGSGHIVHDEALMQILGWYTAEGYVCCDHHRRIVRLCLSADEVDEYNSILAMCAARGYRVRGPYYYNRSGMKIEIVDERFTEFCETHVLGMAQTKQLSKELMNCLASNEDSAKAFMRCYAAGDAGIEDTPTHGHVRLGSSSEVLMNQLYWILNKHGIHCRRDSATVPGGPTNRDKECIQYIVYIGRHAASTWFDTTPSRTNRVKFWQIPSGTVTEIDAIDELPYCGPVHNLEVDGGHQSYLANGFAVHNCWEAAVAAIQALGLFTYEHPANYFSNRQLTSGELPLFPGVTAGALEEVIF